MKLLVWFEKKSNKAIISFAMILALLVGLTDYLTGKEISFSIFYLMPILLVTWYVGKTLALYFSVLSSFEWLIADQLTNPAVSHPSVPLWNMSVRLFFFLIIVVVTSGLKSALEREKKISRTDPLTGVSNARYFYEFAEIELERARRYGHLLTIVYLDLDNFKYINDNFGHLTGDRLLKLIADTIHSRIRAIDIVARLGGDEFVILLPEVSYLDAQVVVERMKNLLVEVMKGNRWPVTFSMGMITYRSLPESVDSLIKEADDLMYAAKRNGKNKIEKQVV
jgi:diguanylate cyclase (GGDEF)-like protein